MKPSDQIEVAKRLSDLNGGFKVSEAIIKRIRDIEGDDNSATEGSGALALGYIGQRRFDEAIDELSKIPTEEDEVSRIATTFNLGMAKWAALGEPNPEIFQRVIEMEDSHVKYVNYVQCMAIAHYVVGDFETAKLRLKRAKAMLARHPVRSFSPWTFSEASPPELKKHLAELQAMIEGKDIVPAICR
jgi:hypothetical protein